MVFRFFILIGFVLCVQHSEACERIDAEKIGQKENPRVVALKQLSQKNFTPNQRLSDLIELDKRNFTIHPNNKESEKVGKEKSRNLLKAVYLEKLKGTDNEAGTIG